MDSKAALKTEQVLISWLDLDLHCFLKKIYPGLAGQGLINSLRTVNPKMGTMTNSEDPDKMLHKSATFYQGLHCLLRLNPSSRKEI